MSYAASKPPFRNARRPQAMLRGWLAALVVMLTGLQVAGPLAHAAFHTSAACGNILADKAILTGGSHEGEHCQPEGGQVAALEYSSIQQVGDCALCQNGRVNPLAWQVSGNHPDAASNVHFRIPAIIVGTALSFHLHDGPSRAPPSSL